MGYGYYMSFPHGKKKTLTLSYDDGVRQDRKLIEILDKYGIKATFNVNSGRFSNDVDFSAKQGRMSREEVCELFKNSPHELAIHGLEHCYDDLLPENIMTYEILEDRRRLEQLSGKIIRGMAYPFGTYNDALVKCLEVCGIAYSRTTISSHSFKMPKDWLRLEATCHHRDKKLDDLCDDFLNNTPGRASMFYLWGHSYEFDYNVPDNNWEIIEKFAEKMGGHDDIWYATNIEIYDYTKAYESLRFSTDGSMVHNPTSTDIWFSKGWNSPENTYMVKAGETLLIK